jgi:hypothetical protein
VENHRHIWQVWAETLQRWGLQNLVATLCEATRPLNLLGAQVVYLSQPLFKQLFPADHLDALVDILEDPEQMQRFTQILRQPAG